MAIEIRQVPPDWEHPKDLFGNYIPLGDGAFFNALAEEWDFYERQWRMFGRKDDCQGGMRPLTLEESQITYEEYAGPRPDPTGYMPFWSRAEATCFQLYETTITDPMGTPIGPVCSTMEDAVDIFKRSEASRFF